MKKLENSPPVETPSHFHCSAEWHFARFKSNAAGLIHPWALKISKTTGKFSVSEVQAGEYLDISRHTAHRAYGELEDTGFFEILEYGQFDSNVYKVLSHKEWSVLHPGQCCQKVEYPWTPENDSLGNLLWATSGGRVKFKQFQIEAYRNFGRPDEEVISLFKEWREGPGQWRQPRNVPKHFLKHLRELETEKDKVLV